MRFQIIDQPLDRPQCRRTSLPIVRNDFPLPVHNNHCVDGRMIRHRYGVRAVKVFVVRLPDELRKPVEPPESDFSRTDPQKIDIACADVPNSSIAFGDEGKHRTCPKTCRTFDAYFSDSEIESRIRRKLDKQIGCRRLAGLLGHVANFSSLSRQTHQSDEYCEQASHWVAPSLCRLLEQFAPDEHAADFRGAGANFVE